MKVTFNDKHDLVQLSNVRDENKITAEDINSIKDAINYNDDVLSDTNKQIASMGKTIDLANNAINTNAEKINQISNNGNQIGLIIPYLSKINLPQGYLLLNGQSLSKTEYSKLYSVIGDKYGSTSTTFNLPNQNSNNSGDEISDYYYIIKAK